MTDGSNQQSTPKRDLLLSLWDSVLREQLPEGMFPWWQKLNTLSRDWVKHDSDRPVQEFLDAMPNQGQPDGPPPETAFYLRRALRLTQLLDHTFRTDPIDPPWSDDVILPCAEAVAAELKAAGHRPLRARPYPPYPQLTVVATPALPWNGPMRSRQTHRFVLQQIEASLSHWRTVVEIQPPPELVRKFRTALLVLWQSPSVESVYARIGDTALREEGCIPDLAVRLAGVNDAFANTCHIDPRFANFIPFATIHEAPTFSPDAGDVQEFLAGALASSQWNLSEFWSAWVEKQEWFVLDDRYSRSGIRGRSLHARLSVADPPQAISLEREYPQQSIWRLSEFIYGKLEARERMEREDIAVDSPFPAGLLPGSLPRLEALPETNPYKSASELLLDLKQFHQAVGETYGGVALAPMVRRFLIMAGEMRLHGRSQMLVFQASQIEDIASELGLRAGILTEPLASYSPKDAQAAVERLCAERRRLAGVLDAGSLSESCRATMGILRAARWLLENVGPDSVPCLVLSGVTSSVEPAAALALMGAMDEEFAATGSEGGSGLLDRLSICVGLDAGVNPEFPARILCDLAASAPMAAYLQSRGGHLEVMPELNSGTLPDAAFHPHPSGLTCLRFRRLARHLRAATRLTLTHVIAVKQGCQPTDAIACFPPDTLNQHLRVLIPARITGHLGTTTHAVRQLFDAPLAELTRQSWLNRTPETPDDIAAEATALTAIESAWQSMLADHAAAGVTPESHPDWFAAIEPWFGIEHVAGLPKPANPANRFPAVALDLAADAMHRHHPRSLSMLAWRTLPKGAYSRLFPAIERAWHTAQSAIDAAEHWPRTPTLTATLANADAILAMLPEEAS